MQFLCYVTLSVEVCSISVDVFQRGGGCQCKWVVFFICELSTCYVTTFYMNCEAQKSFRRYLQKGNMLLETACQRLTKGGRGRVLVILPLLIVSIHFLLLLYPFQCDQPQFCVAGQAQGQLLESTGDWEARC